ncbi:MAG: glycosyltransferase [Candidatus Micrarchaeia archaeon]
MDTLNIAFYSDTYLPAMDGVVTSIMNTRRELESRGHNVYLFVSGNRATKEALKGDRHVFVAPSAKFNRYPQYNIAFFPFTAYFKFRNLDIDVIHVHTPFTMGFYGLLTSKLNRLPIVGSFHTMFTDKEVIDEYMPASNLMKRYALRYSWKYAHYFYRRCDYTIAPTRTVSNILKKKHINNSVIIPNGVDMSKFNKNVDGSKLREKLARGNKKVVLYVGRLSREKHLEVLIRAIKRLDDDYVLVVGGTGPMAHAYMNLSARLGLSGKVKFVGFIKDSILPDYYAAADVVCLPSTFETQGIVLLEAMATGTPVVGANRLALQEIIKNGKNGEKFKPGSTIDCARKIEKVINNIDAYKGTVSTAKEYSIEKVADKLIDLYKKLQRGDTSFTSI